jgi:pilus assembly protein CpaE
MDRPTVLLAIADNLAPTAEAVLRAGMEPILPEDAATRLQDGQAPDLAVIDCDRDPTWAKTVHDQLQADHAVPSLLLFADDPPEWGTMRDEYALKPCPPDALVYRLQALLIRAGRKLPTEVAGTSTSSLSEAPLMGEGKVVSVFAPKGGVGKTTLAVNMAVALRQQTGERVLLFDADVGVGNVTSVFDAPVKHGLVDLADSPESEWTDAAFENVVATHPGNGVRVLTWGNNPGESESVTVDLLLAALRWGKDHHMYVVVDNHPGYDDRTLAMLTLASEIVLVLTPEVGAIRNAAQFLDLARDIGLADIVRVVVNRANHGIAVRDIAASLKKRISATIVSNGPKAVMSANEGRPIIERFPRERISLDLQNVARMIANGSESTEQPAALEARRHWWLRLGERVSGA